MSLDVVTGVQEALDLDLAGLAFFRSFPVPALSDDGSLLAIGGREHQRNGVELRFGVFDVESRQRLALLRMNLPRDARGVQNPVIELSHPFTSIEFSPDHDWLAVGMPSGLLQVWPIPKRTTETAPETLFEESLFGSRSLRAGGGAADQP